MSKTRTITPNPPADFVPSKNDVSYLRPFRVWCQKVLPLVYDDSLSYYELLCKVVDFLNKTMEEVNQLGVDVSNLFNAFQQLQDYVNHYFESLDVQEEINNKLDELIQNGTFTQLLKDYLPFITLSMFGAHQDGNTDDSDYLIEALNLSSTTGKTLYLEHDIAIGKSITIPNNAKLFSFNSNISPRIFVLNGVSEAFICDETNVSLNGFTVTPKSGEYSEITAFTFNNINSDLLFKNITVSYCNTGIKCKSRNVLIQECLFTHCKTGIYFDLDKSQSQFRGLCVDNNRFHGIGEELAIGWFENSSCIVISNDNTGNITIRNNTVEQSGTFITGYMSNMLVENNMCECYAKPIIVFSANTPSTPSNTGSILICGNYFTGKRGQVTLSYTADYPENIIVINNVYRVNLHNNVFKFSGKELLSINNSNGTTIKNNVFNSGGMNEENASAILATNSTLYVQNNSNIKDMLMFSPNSVVHVFDYIGNSIELPDNDNITVTNTDTWFHIGSGKGNEPLTFPLYKETLVVIRGQNIAFKVCRYGDYYSGGSYLIDSTHIITLSFLQNDNGVTPLLNTFEIPSMTRTPNAFSLDFFTRI